MNGIRLAILVLLVGVSRAETIPILRGTVESDVELVGNSMVAKLEEAIRIFPDYSEARCNLGVQYIRLSRFAEAVEQFDKAIAIDATALIYSNLSYALLELGRIAEAEQAGRLAIAKDSSSGP